MKQLSQRYGAWAVVAGASEGIGAAFARGLADAGFSLVLLARRAAPLETLANELRGRCKVETLTIDLGAPDIEVQLRAIAAEREVGLVVYNAALSIVAPFLETSIADKARIIDVNVRGPLIVTHVFGEAMAARGRGAIILMSSLTAFCGTPWIATYGATKAFNLTLSEALAVELRPKGIDVVACCAGATDTPGYQASIKSGTGPQTMSAEAVAQKVLAALPMRGAFVPGAFNRFGQFFLARLLPRRWAAAIMGGETKKLLR